MWGYITWLVAVIVLACVVSAVRDACRIIGIILDYEDQRNEAEQ